MEPSGCIFHLFWAGVKNGIRRMIMTKIFSITELIFYQKYNISNACNLLGMSFYLNAYMLLKRYFATCHMSCLGKNAPLRITCFKGQLFRRVYNFIFVLHFLFGRLLA